MGLKLSRNIKAIRINILAKVKNYNLKLYKFLILFGAIFKFLYKLNANKKIKFYSNNLDEINNFEFKKTSQNNEDGIINYIISILKIENINFVEIGFDYYENNCLNLLKKSNKGLFIDGSSEKVFLLGWLLKIFFPLKKTKVLNEIINKDNVNAIISKYFINENEIDFMSIDVDGIDYYIFENLKYRPKILCIEYNFWYGSEEKCSVPYSENFTWKIGSTYSGSSLNALCSLANLKNYHLIALDTACVNAFFIRGDLKENFQILNPQKSFKIPNKYSDEDVKIAKKELLGRDLTFF